MRKCIEKLAQVPFREISLGYRIVTLFDENNINKRQIGYSRTSEGDDLTGTEPGDWRSSWLVIGYDDRTGNPIFIDTSNISPSVPKSISTFRLTIFPPFCIKWKNRKIFLAPNIPLRCEYPI